MTRNTSSSPMDRSAQSFESLYDRYGPDILRFRTASARTAESQTTFQPINTVVPSEDDSSDQGNNNVPSDAADDEHDKDGSDRADETVDPPQLAPVTRKRKSR